jgi:aspartyl-tRNA(Asn)/glutamyl-tRNA(Gln) amidotransferase subunit A
MHCVSPGHESIGVFTEILGRALGTDTGGSVRLPAAYTGILGFKPSYGLISRWGVIAYANSLDTVGILGGTCETVRNTFGKVPFAIGIHTEILEANLTTGKGILNQYDARDPTSLPSQSRSRILELISNHRREGPLRIGVPIEYNIQELSPTVKQAWESTIKTLKSQGHSIHPVSLPATRQALSAYYVLAPAEASSNLAKYDGIRYGTRAKARTDSEAGYLYAQTRGEGFGDEVRRRILLGAFSLSAEAMDNYFIQAQKVRRLVQADFDGAFRLPNPLQTERRGDGTGVDVLICPTAPSVPPTLESLRDSSPIDAYMNDVFTVPASLAGLPAMSVPVAVESEAQRVDGVNTVGIQVIGQYGDDDLVLRIGEVIEENNART